MGWARCIKMGSRTEIRTEGKEWRGGGKEGGRRGVLSYHRPCLYIPPLLSLAPRSHQSVNHTSPEDSEGTWEGLHFLAKTEPDKRLKAILIAVTVCRSAVTLEGPGEISGGKETMGWSDNGRICTLTNKSGASGKMQISPPSWQRKVTMKEMNRR